MNTLSIQRFLMRLCGIICLSGLAFIPSLSHAKKPSDGGKTVTIPGGKIRPNSEAAQHISAGYWKVTWVEINLTPNMKTEDNVTMRCYTNEDVRRHSNIVMPVQQEKKCKTETMMIGSDIVFDTTCTAADHRLRIEECSAGFCGSYRYAPRGDGSILEALVFLEKISESCPKE